MRKLLRERFPLAQDVRYRAAQPDDVPLVVRESCRLYVPDGKGGEALAAVYLDLRDDSQFAPQLGAIAAALPRIRYVSDFRSMGLPTTSRIFGFRPRLTVRNDYCSATSLAMEQPLEHTVVAQGAQVVGHYYEREAPDLFAQHRDMTLQKAEPGYALEGDVFTSGIINENNPLAYHLDTGNYPGVWSGMLGFKRDIEGGYLALPEYGVAFEIADRSLFLFDGQRVVHGVTPFRRLSPEAARHTLVYYSLRLIWKCLPLDQEVARIRRARTEREGKRARGEEVPLPPGRLRKKAARIAALAAKAKPS